MDNNEPVNLQGANAKGKSTIKKNGSSGELTTDDSTVKSFMNLDIADEIDQLSWT